MEKLVTRKAGVFLNQSFFLQYTSLILIVLAVVVGALYRPELTQAKEKVTGLPTEGMQLLELEFVDLFPKASTNIRASKLEALTSFLEQHDVVLDASVNIKVDQTEQISHQLALMRSVALFRYFHGHGLPVTSLKVYSELLSTDSQLRVRVRKLNTE